MKKIVLAITILALTSLNVLFAQTAVDYYNQGTIYLNQGDYDRAITAFTQAIRLNPNYAEAYNNRGLAYNYKNDYDRAIADYTQSIRLNPNNWQSYSGRGYAYSRTGDYDRTIADYEASLRINPNHANTTAQLNENLVLRAAERDRITVSTNEVEQQINQLRTKTAQSLGRQPTDAEFAQAVRNETGMELRDYREHVRRQLITQKYIIYRKGALINSIQRPTETEIRSAFNQNRSQLVRPDVVRFSMIQVRYGSDTASRTRARNLAEQLQREIGSSPSVFDEVLRRAQADNSSFQAGDAGYLPRNSEAQAVVGQAFLNTAFSLNQGQVSGLIEGVQGYQIIKITERHASRSLELDDIFQLGTNTTVREYISNFLYQQRQTEANERAVRELAAELRTGR